MIPSRRAARSPSEGRRELRSHFSTSAQTRSAGRIREVDLAAEGDRRLVDLELEARGELHGAEHAQAVLDEGPRVDHADQPPRQVGAPAVRVEVLPGERVVHDRVDREVAPPRRLLGAHPRVAGDDEAAVAAARLRLAAGQADVDRQAGVAAGPDLVDREGLADGVDGAVRGEQGAQAPRLQAVDLEVVVGARDAAHAVAHPAADQERAAAGRADRAAELDDGARDHTRPSVAQSHLIFGRALGLIMPSMMRLFTVEEANALLPELRRLLQGVDRERSLLARLAPEARRAAERASEGGGTPSRPRLRRGREQLPRARPGGPRARHRGQGF